MAKKYFPCVLACMMASFQATPAFALLESGICKVGGDFRLWQVLFDNIIDADNDKDDKCNFFRFRLRVFAELKPSETFRLYARITGEPRYYLAPDMDDEFNRDEFVADNLYAEFRTEGDFLSTTRIGRQDIIQGSRLLILDGTPLDGSRTCYTDAVRQMFKFGDLNLDLFLSRVKRNDPIGRINNQDMPLTDENENVHGIMASGKITDDIALDGYYYYHKTDPDGTDRKTSTIGGRIQGNLAKEVSYSGELACQFGRLADADVNTGPAGEAVLKYKPADTRYGPEFRFSYTYLPGENPSTTDSEAWDAVYGRWPRFSELYIYTCIQETGVALVNNIQAYKLSGECAPAENLTLSGGIIYMRANENPLKNTRIFGGGKERGWLYVIKAAYEFTPSLSGQVLYEYLAPGDYYAAGSRDNGYFFRYMLTYKF